MYARANCQSYNILVDRKNYKAMQNGARLKESDPNAEERQKNKAAQVKAKLHEKAGVIADAKWQVRTCLARER